MNLSDTEMRCAILLATDSIDILKWQAALGFENLIKPVTYEKIATAWKGK